jgi:raffinose/stachyose/melibiose transport system substrate-binding protein
MSAIKRRRTSAKHRRLMGATITIGVTALVAGCSSGGTSAQGSGSVTLTALINSAYQQGTSNAITEFEKANPTVKINATYLPSAQLQTTLLTQLQAGNAPDIFWMNGGAGAPDSPVDLAKEGRLLDLSNQPWANQLGVLKDSADYNGKVYAWMSGVAPDAIYYNTQLFKQMGLSVPTTFSQLLSLCGQIKKAGKIPIAFSADATGSSVGISLADVAMGSDVYGPDPNWNEQKSDNQATFANTPGWKTLLQSIVDMRNAGCFNPQPSGTSLTQLATMVASGNAVMTVSNSALFATVLAVDPKFPEGAFAMPAATAGKTRLTVFEVPDYGINKDTKHPAQAEAFLDFLAQPSATSAFNHLANLISPIEIQKGSAPPWAKQLVPYFQTNRVVSEPTQFWPNSGLRNLIMVPDITGLFTGQETVSSILQDLDKNWNAPS